MSYLFICTAICCLSFAFISLIFAVSISPRSSYQLYPLHYPLPYYSMLFSCPPCPSTSRQASNNTHHRPLFQTEMRESSSSSSGREGDEAGEQERKREPPQSQHMPASPASCSSSATSDNKTAAAHTHTHTQQPHTHRERALSAYKIAVNKSSNKNNNNTKPWGHYSLGLGGAAAAH